MKDIRRGKQGIEGQGRKEKKGKRESRRKKKQE